MSPAWLVTTGTWYPSSAGPPIKYYLPALLGNFNSAWQYASLQVAAHLVCGLLAVIYLSILY